MKSETPSEKWSLARLGQFCVERHQRMAVDVWLVGMAMTLAKDRCKKEGESFTDWKKEHGFSNATASRYMRLYEFHDTEDKVERLKSIGVLQAFIEADLEAPRQTKPRQASAKCSSRQGAAVPDTKTESPPIPSWEVEPGDVPPSPDMASSIIEVQTQEQCLEEELRTAVPWQVIHLKEKVVSLLSVDVERLRVAWPTGKRQRKRIAADIDDLVEVLPQFAATLREEPKRTAAVGRKKRCRRKAA